jgi:protein involved in polysaccharide export with SLBB domain
MMLMILLMLLQLTQEQEDAQVADDMMIHFSGQADRDLYLLGPGDVLSLVVEGGSTEALFAAGVSPWASYPVSGDGYVSISGVGAICVDGMTINEAQDILQQKVSRYYPALHITLSLAQPRVVRVAIMGRVTMSGSYDISALNRVSDLVTLAEGISSFGSRFGTMMTTGGDSVPVDLHINPLTGTYVQDPYLYNAEAVIFRECSSPVYVIGPGYAQTWDCRPGETVRSLMDGMGSVRGSTDPTLSRLVSEGEYLSIWDQENGFSEILLAPGDSLILVSADRLVFVGGAVNAPISIEFRPEYSVLDYILLAGGATVDAKLSGTRLLRDGETIATGEEVLQARPQAGDAIDVPNTWLSKNSSLISLVFSLTSLSIAVYSMTR